MNSVRYGTTKGQQIKAFSVSEVPNRARNSDIKSPTGRSRARSSKRLITFLFAEHNGDFYSCDHFVDFNHRLGNIRETALVDLLESREQRAFGRAKRDSLPRYCRSCEVRVMCNGGCPKDRFIRTPEGEAGLNYLCAGLKRFFIHSRPHLERLAAESRQMQGGARGPAGPGRNDPCPCGSGRKFKKCCLGKCFSSALKR